MKNTVLMSGLVVAFILSGCASTPTAVKNDGQAASERAKKNAERAYEKMKEDM